MVFPRKLYLTNTRLHTEWPQASRFHFIPSSTTRISVRYLSIPQKATLSSGSDRPPLYSASKFALELNLEGFSSVEAKVGWVFLRGEMGRNPNRPFDWTIEAFVDVGAFAGPYYITELGDELLGAGSGGMAIRDSRECGARNRGETCRC